MDINDYQYQAYKTAKYTDKKIAPIVYCSLKLAGEAGEFCEKMGKTYRDNDGNFDNITITALMKELGDVLWYVANLAELFGYKLDEVAQMNLDKLYSRLERGTIHGDGDDR